MFANYHTHTVRCQHASGEDREYVEAAIAAGIRVLGFSDHSPWVYPDGFVSGIRMKPQEIEDYFTSLGRLQKEYRKDIEILIGFEAEYTPSLLEEQDALFEGYPLDYLILGQHFLGPENTELYMGTPTQDEALLERYVNSVVEGMRSGRFLYLAHPDLIHYTGPDEIYLRHMKRLCREMKEMDGVFEFNVLGFATHRHYPSERFLKLAAEMGNRFVLGIDAHSPEQLADTEDIALAERLCEQYGITPESRIL